MKSRTAPFKDERTLTERRHQKAIDALTRAEDKLARALLQWSRARETLKRYDRRADKLLAKTDWRDLAKSAETIKDHRAKEQSWTENTN